MIRLEEVTPENWRYTMILRERMISARCLKQKQNCSRGAVGGRKAEKVVLCHSDYAPMDLCDRFDCESYIDSREYDISEEERAGKTMLKLHSGRPATNCGRLDKEIRVYDLLDSLQITYERLDHEPAMNMEVCGQIETILQAMICKNLFLCNRQESNFYLLMIPGDRVFKTKVLSKQLGVSRLSFAPEKYMEELLDITPGSVSVMGLMNDTGLRVQLVIDADVLKSEYFGCHPCINTTSLRIRTNDLIQKVIPAMGHEPVIVELGG